MVAHRLLSSAMRNNDDDEWPVHSWYCPIIRWRWHDAAGDDFGFDRADFHVVAVFSSLSVSYWSSFSRCRGQASMGDHHSGGICRRTPTTPGHHGF